MWQRGGAVRLKRLSVGPGPTPTITASPTQTLASSGVNEPGGVVIDGDRVIAAYTRDSDLVVQRSTTGGATFRVRRTLLRGDGLLGVAFSIDMRGSRVLLEAGRRLRRCGRRGLHPAAPDVPDAGQLCTSRSGLGFSSRGE